jgi:hypothetical protein
MILSLVAHVAAGNDGITGFIRTTGSSLSMRDTLAAAAIGATGVTGPVKLVNLANGPSGLFMPRPKESRVGFRPFESE